MQDLYNEPSAVGQPRKSSPLKQSVSIRRSPPLPPIGENFDYELDIGGAVVDTLPAPAGTRVLRLDRNGDVKSEHAVIGFVVMRQQMPYLSTKIWVRPVTPLGVVGGKYILSEPEEK